jgi:hypothetical protein
MITKTPLWKQIRLEMKEITRSEKITAAIMKRIKEIENENHKVSTTGHH